MIRQLLYSFLALFLMGCPSNNSDISNKSRVEIAKDENENNLRKMLYEKGIDYEQCEIYLRAFKLEEDLEVWAKNIADDNFTFIKSYNFCTNSGVLGPKRRQGDSQIPEGVYHIDRFNPQSRFYLSLGLNYPNKSDLYFAHKTRPGDNIFIHGDCVSIGCIAITDEKIKELYTLANQAQTNGQAKIRVDIFPIRFNREISKNYLPELAEYEENISFWQNLETIYFDFENNRKLREVKVNETGMYQFD